MDYNNPYSVGQLVGMLFMIELIESNRGIDAELLNRLKMRCADGASEYLNKPAEDVLLMVEQLMGETGIV